MEKPRVALLSFVESRDDFYRERAVLIRQETARVREGLEQDVDLLAWEPIRSLDEARRVALEAKSAGAESALFHVPVWAPPNLAVVAAGLVGVPVAIVANTAIETSGLPGFLSSAGGLDQVGVPNKRIWGDVSNPETRARLRAFFVAASALHRLRGSKYGCLGGRSLGIYTATFDPAQWQRAFGVDAEHVDQLEVVRRSEAVPEKQVLSLLEWMAREGLRAEFNGGSFGPEHLERQVRSYLATGEIVREHGFDFIGLKCQPELSDGFVLQCLSVALLNDPYDDRGPKDPVPCACEADGDGALTMAILNRLSGGAPTTLMDVRAVLPDERIALFANCGGMATFFAARSREPADNFRAVRLVPHVFGRAGGGSTRFVACPGPVTLARLCRRRGEYWMAVARGTAVADEGGLVRRSTTCWPHMLVEVAMDFTEFVETLGANHMHAVAGDFRRELAELCGLVGIQCRVYGAGGGGGK